MSDTSTATQQPRPLTARGEATRKRILQAAEQEFGEKGFHAASVSSITTRANVGQGTFYIYFRAKEDCFVTLVQEIGHELRKHTAQAVSGGRDRIDAERLGLVAFFEFAARHRGLYRIVQECQFVDEGVFREYYRKIAEGYAQGLARAARAGELTAGDAETRAWSIMGIGHFLGMRHCLWDGKVPEPRVVDEVMTLITTGIAPPAVKARLQRP